MLLRRGYQREWGDSAGYTAAPIGEHNGGREQPKRHIQFATAGIRVTTGRNADDDGVVHTAGIDSAEKTPSLKRRENKWKSRNRK